MSVCKCIMYLQLSLIHKAGVQLLCTENFFVDKTRKYIVFVYFPIMLLMNVPHFAFMYFFSFSLKYILIL